MCFNYQSSFATFLIGLVGSFLLIYYGNPRFSLETRVSGIFFIFISFIQFMDFLIWIDIKNTIGLNRLATTIGPLLNIGQPTILYCIKLFYLTPSNMYNLKDMAVAIINIVYFGYILHVYNRFTRESNMITKVSHGHLDWKWLDYHNPYTYLVIFAINIFYLTDFVYSSLVFLITYLFLLLSVKFFKYNVGELWCFFGAFIPIILFLSTFRFNL
jgi:hypothetical protein